MSTTVEAQRAWFEQAIDQAQGDLPGQDLDWLQQTRAHARRAIETLPVPNRKSEEWRYTAIEGLLKNSFQTPAGEADAARVLEAGDWLEPDYPAYRVIIVNGRCIVDASQTAGLPEGATVGSLRAALATDPELLGTWFGQAAAHTDHLFTALNTALINDGIFLHLKPGVVLDRPVEVVYLSLGQEQAPLTQPRNLVVLEKGASATLVERFIGPGNALYFHNGVTELALREGAILKHCRVQDESRNAYHLSSLYLTQDRNSLYQGTTLAFGGAWARTDYQAVFKEEGARCELGGLYTVGDRQLIDFHLDVRHSVPDCSSREQFKGILYGKGRGVFDGRILVEKQAQHSDAHLSNDNLLLTENGEIDTKPQLEIYADDVKCSHGTTVGQIDPQQMFYLRSRGIDADAARRMLCLGFAGEVIEAIEVPELREYASQRLVATLNQSIQAAE
ncbi:MAG: Fe-S cluster assembly protein SufD [Thiogranum sp.]|nr:Fe-S cluster assembly protein SufD [Thiogranum sp.]